MTRVLIMMLIGLTGEVLLHDTGRPAQASTSLQPGLQLPQAITHTYEVRIRLAGTVSKVRVQARDGGHAKKLVRAQYGPKVTVLSAKRID